MKTGTRKEGPSSLKISYTQLVGANLRGAIREVSHFHTRESERGQGHGTRLMKKICAEADHTRIVLMLTADSPKLGDYYAAFGFETVQMEPQIMARAPAQ